jgi:hypothetical protein
MKNKNNMIYNIEKRFHRLQNRVSAENDESRLSSLSRVSHLISVSAEWNEKTSVSR